MQPTVDTAPNGDATRIPLKRWTFVIPVAAVMYMLAFLDRNNVAVVLPFIGNDPSMQLSATDQGLISGIFFVGYMILQIPAAILAQKWSAKNVVLVLMILWGLAAMSTGLVQSRNLFLVARFALGVFEGGIWPAVLILLAGWFPLRERARANSLWMACLPIASIIMAPLSGMLLDYFSWRTVLVIEGIPPILWAIVWWLAVADSPKQASWISDQERTYLETTLAIEEEAKPNVGTSTYRKAFKDRKVIILIAIYFCWISGFYGFNLWLPTVIKELTGGSATTVGWLTTIPYVFSLVAMHYVSSWSDWTGNRKAAVAVPLAFAAIAMVTGQLVHNSLLNIALLCIVCMGLYAPCGSFWAIPAQLLRIEVLAFAMGLINAVGNLGGFLGPYLVGWVTELTGSAANAYYTLAAILGVGVLLTTTGTGTASAIPKAGRECESALTTPTR